MTPAPSTGVGGCRRLLAAASTSVFVFVLGAAAATAGCSHDSYVVLTLMASTGELPNVTDVAVRVRQYPSGMPESLLVWHTLDHPRTIDMKKGLSLSVSFTPDRSGQADFMVDAFNAAGCVAEGSLRTPIAQGETKREQVVLIATTSCTLARRANDGGIGDSRPAGTGGAGGTGGAATASTGGRGGGGSTGGAGGAGGVVTFNGCDPAAPTSCASGQTCFVDCQARTGMCIGGGARGPGETCTSNNDCMPGPQCFDYSGTSDTGCPSSLKVCLKFCSGDAQCTATAGAGPGALALEGCRNPVVCPAAGGGGFTTSYKNCSFACDPRGAATTGCPAGLYCFLYGDPTRGEDSPDCGCRVPSRKGADGDACFSSSDCAPGLICNAMGGTLTCRRLCKMSSAGDCGAATCSPLTNNTTYGVCMRSSSRLEVT